MPANHLVQARIDGAVKEEATAVLAAMGLTVSDAVRLPVDQGGAGEGPTIRAVDPQRRHHRGDEGSPPGHLPQFAGVEDLLDDLHADD